MLTLNPKSWFSWDFRVLDGDEELALIDHRWLREGASFSIGGRDFDVRRTSVVRGTFVLERAGVVLAEAAKPSAFRRTFEIRAGADQYRLVASTVFGRAFELWHSGAAIGRIWPKSLWGRAATADLPDTLSRETQLFIVFLVLALWKRAAAATAGS